MSNFERVRLDSLVTFGNGKTLPSAQGEINAYGGNGVIGRVQSPNYPAKTIIVGRVGSQCGNVHKAEKSCWVTDNALAGIPKKETDFEFLYYLLKQLKLNELRVGSGQPLVTQTILNRISIAVPQVADYRRQIGAVLSALDAKIELNNRINAELEGMAKLLYDYWFVQHDFPISAAQAAALGKPHLTGKPYRSSGCPMTYNPQLKHEIPAGWLVKELSDIADITMGQSPPGHTYNEDGKGILFFQGSTDFGWRFPSPRQFTTAPTRLAKKGSILLSVRAPVGTLNIAPVECAIGRGLAALSSKISYDSFLFQVLLNLQSIFARRNTDGTTFGSINRDDLRSLKVVCPPDDKLLAMYEAKVGTSHALIFNNHQQNQELAKLRDWLLPMLINGQVRVL